jgi:hypothetical protein
MEEKNSSAGIIAGIAFVVLIVSSVVYTLWNDAALRRFSKEYAAKRFVELQCKRGHYVGAKYEPVMIYNCTGGEFTYEALLEEGRTQFRNK